MPHDLEYVYVNALLSLELKQKILKALLRNTYRGRLYLLSPSAPWPMRMATTHSSLRSTALGEKTAGSMPTCKETSLHMWTIQKSILPECLKKNLELNKI